MCVFCQLAHCYLGKITHFKFLHDLKKILEDFAMFFCQLSKFRILPRHQQLTEVVAYYFFTVQLRLFTLYSTIITHFAPNTDITVTADPFPPLHVPRDLPSYLATWLLG